ncbi:MAG: glutamate carboxypeptidase [Clostridiales bacterium]|nr:glutamate carboxypeptidase [Clostridiales bacterium]MDN5298193.1 glutamate carboxypeptidase [Clostridiales bacterium]
MIKNIIENIEHRTKDTISLLEKLVNIDSGYDNPEGIHEVAHIVGDKLTAFGFDVEYITDPGLSTHVLAKRKGKSNKNIMIIGHMDTVFSKGTAEKRPFKIIDDKAYGPGVLDMKSGLVIALSALQSLSDINWQEHNLTVLFCGDEEVGHHNDKASKLFMKEAKGKDAVFNMETGSDDGAVVVGRKGAIYPEIHIQGKSTHAGKDPQKGASAVLELANKTVDLHALTDYEAGITYNVGVVEGGTVPNAIAGHAKARLDIRVTTVEQIEIALNQLRTVAEKQYVKGTTTSISNDHVRFMPMEKTEQTMKLFQVVQDQGKQLGIEPEIQPITVGGGSDSCWTVMAGAPTVCAMGARGELNHGEHEYIHLFSLDERAKLLACTITAL